MAGELPPLPPKRVINRHLPTGVALHGYNADDMRAYAAAAVAAARARSETAVAVLRQIAAAPRKTREQRLASSCLALLDDGLDKE